MAYTAWSVVFGEQPSASKWNQLGSNDAHFYGFLGDNEAWQSWTPSYANITVGNGAVVAKYTQIGQTVHFFWSLTCGSTTAISNANTVTPPVTPKAEYSAGSVQPSVGTATAVDVGTALFNGWCTIITDLFRAQWSNYAGGNSQTSTTFPITEASGDRYTLSGTYEAA